MKIFKNDVLVLEIDKLGFLRKKEFYNKDDMKKLKLLKQQHRTGFKRNTFIYEFHV